MAVNENGVKRTLPYLTHKKGGKSWFEMMEPEMLEDLGKLMMQGEKFLRKAYENEEVFPDKERNKMFGHEGHYDQKIYDVWN